jgi:hypothetical protein
MDVLERRALLAAMVEAWSPRASPNMTMAAGIALSDEVTPTTGADC